MCQTGADSVNTTTSMDESTLPYGRLILNPR
jgi:hypothetical protein